MKEGKNGMGERGQKHLKKVSFLLSIFIDNIFKYLSMIFENNKIFCQGGKG